MPAVLGIDLGTTTITALAVESGSGNILACCTLPNAAETTSPADRARGRSEWDIRRMAEAGCACLGEVANRLGEHRHHLAGLGITGQQHGCVVVDAGLNPLTPLVNWQDRRGEEPLPGLAATCVQHMHARCGDEAPHRTGCRLAAGFMSVTLFWLRAHRLLPPQGTACFVMDYFGSFLTGSPPLTDPTGAASSGVFTVRDGAWDSELLEALELPRSCFPEVVPSGSLLGRLSAAAASATGLPEGLPVFVGMGDNQASFLGSVARRDETVLVNVGTGGQVSMFAERFAYDPQLETRPFPGGGYLLACVGLCGGRTYAALERFFRQVGADVLGTPAAGSAYAAMNRLASSVPRGANGLRCEPFFTGTRFQPNLRASWTGMSTENFTPAHMTRALLEGMARAFQSGYEVISGQLGRRATRLVGAGNGMRENPVLAGLVAEEFGLPLAVPRHREEAAYGAALLAAVAAGLVPDLPAAGALLQYEERTGR
jgi:sugar (pentulose or hexulose) kinase